MGAANAAASAITADDVAETLEFLVARKSPNGAEAELASEFAAWGAERFPELAWHVDRFDGSRANLIANGSRGSADGSGRGHGIYAHLDTSLSGDPDRDRWITGRSDEPAPFRCADGNVSGHGIAVAKGSVAGGLIATVTARRALEAAGLDHRLSFLLAAGGTHRNVPRPDRRPTFGVGIRRALDQGWVPASVLNVKAGAPAPLHEEPGAAYLRVTVRGSWDPILFRDSDPGTLAAMGPLLTAVEETRRWMRSRPIPPGSIVGRELGLGAVRAGDLDKADLLPAILEAGLFAVTAPGDDITEIRDELDRTLIRHLDDAGCVGLVVASRIEIVEPGAACDPDSPIVEAVDEEWRRRLGPPPAVEDWRGSTDAVVLRSAGIPTVRCGPPVDRDPHDLRRDVADLDVLVTFARIWAAVIVREAARTGGTS